MNYYSAITFLHNAATFTGNDEFKEIAVLLKKYEAFREQAAFLMNPLPQQSCRINNINLNGLVQDTLTHTKRAIDNFNDLNAIVFKQERQGLHD